MLLACAVAVVLLVGAGAAQAPTYALSIDAFDEPESQLTRATIPHIGYSLLLFSTLAAAAFIGVTAVATRATAMLPGWIAWSGFLASGLLLFSVLFVPMITLPLWVLAVGISLWRSDSLACPLRKAPDLSGFPEIFDRLILKALNRFVARKLGQAAKGGSARPVNGRTLFGDAPRRNRSVDHGART